MKPLSIRRRFALALAAGLVLSLGVEVTPVRAQEDIPPAVDPGEPTYVGSDDRCRRNRRRSTRPSRCCRPIYDADLAAGGQSFWIDRILNARPFNGGNSLYTRGSALYMYTHKPNMLGFAGQGTGANQGGGGFAYREPIARASQNLYTVTISGATLAEQTAERAQYPSHWPVPHRRGAAGRRAQVHHPQQRGRDDPDVTNTGAAPTTRTHRRAPIAYRRLRRGTELIGTFNARYGLTTMSPAVQRRRLHAQRHHLIRDDHVDPGHP